jgi:hypothetical protein
MFMSPPDLSLCSSVCALICSADGSTYQLIDGSRFDRHISGDGLPYFHCERLVTPNDLADKTVIPAFLMARDQINQCFEAHNAKLGHTCEVVIVLRCLSSRRPMFYYYIVDHIRRRIVDTHTYQEGLINADDGTFAHSISLRSAVP